MVQRADLIVAIACVPCGPHAVLLSMRAREDFGSGRATHDKGLVYPIVACALSSVVVSAASRFVAFCCRPCVFECGCCSFVLDTVVVGGE